MPGGGATGVLPGTEDFCRKPGPMRAFFAAAPARA
jgi:hypothetical protein